MVACYVRALSTSGSLAATGGSSGANYILSGVMGVVIFGDARSLAWWLGVALIVGGVGLVSSSQTGDAGATATATAAKKDR